MSYAGKYVGQNVGSWLGSQDSDPNALYATLSGVGGTSGTLTAVAFVAALLAGGGGISAEITFTAGADDNVWDTAQGMAGHFRQREQQLLMQDEQDLMDIAMIVGVTWR